MDLSNIDPALIEARGCYATVNGEYKDLMKKLQAFAQGACDDIRHGLQDIDETRFHLAHSTCQELIKMAREASELKDQKEALYVAAWGDK